MGFEDNSVWSNSSGTSSIATEGDKSVSVVAGSAETVMVSAPLSTLAGVPAVGKLDVYIPDGITTSPYIRLEYSINSIGVPYGVLGEWVMNAGTYPPGQFHTLTFNIDSTIHDHLTANYSDLVLTIKVNGAQGNEMLIDNLRIGTPSSNESSGGTTPVTDPSVNTSSWSLPISNTHQYWVVERKMTDDITELEKNDGWYPIGIHNTLGGNITFNGAFIFRGELHDELERIVSMSPVRLRGAKCEGPNGECLNPDWVPAIQNELIGSESRYEKSYEYYLQLARQAAAEAGEAREVLLSDILNSLNSSNVQDAQIDQYLNEYLTDIGGICGDTVEKDALRNKVASCISEADFSQCLLDEVYNGGNYYSCEFSTTGDSTDLVRRKGAVQCALGRSCEDKGVSLSSLGVLKKSEQSIGELSRQVLSFDYILNPGFDQPCSESGMDVTSCVKQKLWRLSSWADQYKRVAKQLIQSQTIPWLPDIFVQAAGTNSNELVTTNSVNAQEGNYGEYYEKVQQIYSKISEISTAAETYLSYFDDIAKNADLVMGSMDRLDKQTDLNIIERILSAQAQEIAIESNYKASTLDCIRNQRALLGYPQTGVDTTGESPAKKLLKRLDENFLNDQTHSVDDIDQPNGAYDSCISSVSGLGLALEYGDAICELVESRFSSLVKSYSKILNSMYGSQYYKCVEGLCDIRWGELENSFYPKPTTPFGYRCRDQKQGCNDQWLEFKNSECLESGDLKYVCNWNRQTGDGCIMGAWHPARTIRHLCQGGTFNIAIFEDNTEDQYDAFVDALDEKITDTIFTHCESKINGCSIDEDGLPVSCNGPALESAKSQSRQWSDDGVLASMTQDLADLDKLLEVERFGASLIELGRNIANSKTTLSSNIRGLVTLVSELTLLEEKQIDIFNSLIANRKTAVASNITALKEWSSRFDFRKEDYERKLKRARYLAWVALRSIEFRFGVKLEDITQGTPTMDPPSQWVKDLWETWTTIRNTDESAIDGTEEGKAFSDYLAPEEQIERYVDSLGDFVLSYGNNPTSTTQWWLHEDDDTGVISLRDNIMARQIGCPSSTNNMLYFSEELDMDASAMNMKYLDSIPYWDEEPSTWEKINTTSNEFSIYPGGSELGEGYSTNMVSQNVASEDWTDDENGTTAEYLEYSASTGEKVYIEQVLNRAMADFAWYGDANVSSNVLEFSLSHRSAPINSTGKCSVGEVFFPEIGRCGVPCSIDSDTIEPFGTCQNGQVCTSAGAYEENGETFNDGHMCTWCTADMSCLAQDGQAFAMHLMDGNGTIARRNVQTQARWSRDTINTFDDAVDSSFFTGIAADSMAVAIENTVTVNRLNSSEDFVSGWTFDTPTVNGTLEPFVQGPDYTRSATKICVANTSGSLLSSVAAGSNLGTTASIWIKSDDIDETSGFVTLSLLGGAGGTITETLAVRKIRVSDSWERFNIETPQYSENVQFKIHINNAQVLVWGAQLEDGLGATPYLATDKNLLANSWQFASLWTGQADIVGEPDIKAPNGRMGVEKVVDNSLTENESITYNIDRTRLQVGDYVFSLWVKNVQDQIAGNSEIIVNQQDVSGALISTTPLQFTPTEQWQRIELPIVTNATNTTGNISINISPVATVTGQAPTTGALLVWGPQFEKGATSTGYQPTGADPSWSAMDWGFDIGVSEAGLVPLKPYDCSIGSLMQTCVADSNAYARNVYHRNSYPGYCNIVNGTGMQYPPARELSAIPSLDKRKQLFINSFKEKESDLGEKYYSYNFRMNSDSIRNSDSLNQFGVIAPNNFNYRIKTVAMNVAGTDVIDCSLSQSPETCAANQWLTYDFSQVGPVSVKNHRMERMYDFDIPMGNVRGGKAWVAEQIVGYPVSGVHLNALSQIQKTALMGRPLDGTFELRIYQSPDLIWENVEDIQLVLGYHYWTKSE
ncbi:MAG: hypothetical protein JXR76_02220 [Deltaproteobacteria bacterium]|nr:hypothetical protein [Deltaproteobacteria bacterium]